MKYEDKQDKDKDKDKDKQLETSGQKQSSQSAIHIPLYAQADKKHHDHH